MMNDGVNYESHITEQHVEDELTAKTSSPTTLLGSTINEQKHIFMCLKVMSDTSHAKHSTIQSTYVRAVLLVTTVRVMFTTLEVAS